MENKKYYWLKLQKNFFKRHDIRIIESMPNGKDYILFYLKLLVESVSHEGELRFSETIPYNENMLATITNTNVDIVRAAMLAFIDLGMISILEDETIFMTEVQKMIGSSANDERVKESTRERVRKYRDRQKALPYDEEVLQKRYSNVTCNGEKEKEKEIEIEGNNNTNVLADDKRQRVDYQRIVDLYNSTCKSFSKVMALTDKRKKAIKSMLNRYTESEVLKVFEKAEASDFMKSGSWCGFDWLMKEANFVKVIEGNYDNKHKAKDKSLAQRFMEADIHDT